MDILFGKLKIKVKPEHAGTKATISTAGGFTKEVDLVAPETNVILPGLEEYVITFAVNGAVQTFKLGYGEIVVCTSGWVIPPWSIATDEEIIDICNRFYNDEITLDEIKEVWSVGDRREVSLPYMPTGGYVGETHTAQNVEFDILDFEHDALTAPINGHNKALLTVQQHSVLSVSGENDNSEAGYLNQNDAYMYAYAHSQRRSWCNDIYKSSLPLLLSENVKLTHHFSEQRSDTSAFETDDYVFLLAVSEVIASSYASDGRKCTLYKYYETALNRIKYAGFKDSGTPKSWWTRSYLYGSSSTVNAHIVSNTGTDTNARITNIYAIAPAFCL